VQTTLHQDYQIDLATVVDTLPEGLTNLNPGWINPQIEVTLTLAGLARCSGAEDDLALFWRLLKRSVEEDDRFRPPPTSVDTPRLRTADLASEWQIPMSRFSRLVKILNFEPWAYVSNKVSEEDWELMIGPMIRQFGSVKTLEEYLNRRASLSRRNKMGRQGPVPSPTEATPNIHISIYGGTVGTLNLGQVIGGIETHVNAVTGGSADQFKLAVKQIVESVQRDESLTQSAKAAVLEHVEYLAEAAASPPPNRKLSVITRVVGGIGEATGAASDARGVWNTWSPTVRRFFSLLDSEP
jgi:hypothetical protein